MQTHFTDRDLAFIITGLLLVAGSIVAFSYGKRGVALGLLIAGGFTVRLLMAFIDPFVNIWDEQFHAVVARNMMEHPFTPTLYENPVMPYTPESWASNHIWVHKPPLFLWQIALAMKIFGAKVWAVRLPSVLLTTLAIPVMYRMGKLLSHPAGMGGYYAALLFTVVNLQVNVVSGFLNTDHNDVVFMCYVLFSFWAWTEYMFSPARRWIVLAGIFAGLAVLVKWLPGLLVYGAWFVAIVADKQGRTSREKWKHLFAALALTAAVAAPWFIYTWIKWPAEAAATMELHSRHLHEDLGHPGPWWYHFAQLKEDYGWWMMILLPPALFIFAKRKSWFRFHENYPLRLGIFSAIVFVYLFYTFVPTRMPLFTLMVAPLLLLVLADLFMHMQILVAALQHGQTRNFFRPLLLVVLPVLTWMIFDTGRLEYFHPARDKGNIYRPARIHNRAQFEKAAATLPSAGYVIFNCGGYANGVACMFYTGFTAYDGIPGEEQFQKLKAQGIKMAVFGDVEIPAYMRDDPEGVKLHFALMRPGF